ncbi:hypothetical protein DL96DRAFT_1616993 [Flagelloscypha sp. PMI_526]|nr:hypothetical protein DL96DRAFT_1616993 [Flagelloscypha sp. PMI_526]
MTAELPSCTLTNQSILRIFPSYSPVELEKITVDGLKDYLSRATHRSPFLGESWLRKEYDRCIATLDTLKDSRHVLLLSRQQVQTKRNSERAINYALEILESLLALPVQLLPNLPVDVMDEIFKWAAAMDYPAGTMSLVSSHVQRCVGPILFADCTVFRNPKPSVFFSNSLSLRLQRCRTFVRAIRLSPGISQAHIDKLSNLFPNATTLILLGTFSTFPSIKHSSIFQLHCQIIGIFHHGPLHFFNQLFKQLTTISFSFAFLRSTHIEDLDWTQFICLTSLKDFWLSIDVCSLVDLEGVLVVLRNQALPQCPKCLELFAVLLHFDNWMDNSEVQAGWSNRDLCDFAAGLWDPRAVLLRWSDGYTHIDEAVEASYDEKERVWDRNREKAMRVVTARHKKKTPLR